MSQTDPATCQPQACELQSCLNKNKYNPDLCQSLVRKLYQCCHDMYASNPKAEVSACPILSAVNRWLDRHPETPPSK